jgi:hypothetical protein
MKSPWPHKNVLRLNLTARIQREQTSLFSCKKKMDKIIRYKKSIKILLIHKDILDSKRNPF